MSHDGSGFETFNTVANGFRAACRCLRTYQRMGILTIEDVINRWAPRSENPTDKYIEYVCRRGAEISAFIHHMPFPSDKGYRSMFFDTTFSNIMAMSEFESGNRLSEDEILEILYLLRSVKF